MESYADTLPQDSANLMLPGEKIILHHRQHRIAILVPIMLTVIFGSLALFILSAFFLWAYNAAHMMLLSDTIVLLVILSLITRVCVDWYFHVYMVTNRRILEIQYRPFFSQDVNDVLLDQVRCTEVDVKIHGYVHGLIDVGDIIITFDRPTHEQEFVLHDIKSPRKVGTLLGDLLNTPKNPINATANIWHKGKNRYGFTEELYPTSMPARRMYV